MNYQK